MGILERELEFDSIDAVKNAPPHHTIKKKIKKKKTHDNNDGKVKEREKWVEK